MFSYQLYFLQTVSTRIYLLVTNRLLIFLKSNLTTSCLLLVNSVYLDGTVH